MARPRFRLLFVLVALLLIAPTTAVLAQSPVPVPETPQPPLAEAMPADIPLYVATEFDPNNAQYVELGALLAQTLVPNAGDTVAAIVQKVTAYLVSLPSDVSTVVEGEVGIGVINFGELDLTATSGGSGGAASASQSVLPGYAIVFHPQQAGSARQIVQEWFTQQIERAGNEPETTVDGAVVILKNPQPDTAYIPDVPAVIAFSGDYIIVGPSEADVQPFIGATRGAVPALADSADLVELNAALPTDRLLFGYLNGGELLSSLAGMFNSSTLAQSMTAPFGATAFTLAAGEPGIRFESVSKPLTTSRGRVERAGENPDFASRVPDTTLAMITGQDLGQSWAMQQLEKSLLSLLGGALGAGDLDLTNADAGAEFGVISMLTGVDFKADLIDQLQGNYGAALFSVDTEDPMRSSAVIASELAHPNRVSVAVTSLGPLIQMAGSGTASVTTASIADQTVNNVTLVQPVEGTIQYGVVNDWLMVGLGDGLATLATVPEASLADSTGYQAALAQLPASYDGAIYLDVRGIARAIAPLVVQTIAENSNNSLAACITANTTPATPVAVDSNRSALGVVCSMLGGLLGPDALQDFIVSRIPGPLAAVTYEDGGLQHVSGVLMMGSSN